MTDHTAQADVAAILEGLRAEVRARRISQGQPDQSLLERDLQRSLDEIELHRVVSAHWPLLGRSLPQRAVAVINKLVRRYLRWYINPIVEQQNAYNDAVARALRLLAEAYADLREQGSGVGGQETGGAGDRETGRPADRESQVLAQAASLQPPASSVQPLASSLQAEIERRAAAEPPARFPDLELRALEPQLRLRARVSAHWPLPAVTLPQRAIATLNKLVRRYLRWYINPIVDQQNAANAAITAALLASMRLDAERRGQAAALRAYDKMKR